MLSSENDQKYRIYSYEISQNDLVKLLESKGFEYEQSRSYIIVNQISAIEIYFEGKNITIQKEKLSLSEVYFNEK